MNRITIIVNLTLFLNSKIIEHGYEIYYIDVYGLKCCVITFVVDVNSTQNVFAFTSKYILIGRQFFRQLE